MFSTDSSHDDTVLGHGAALVLCVCVYIIIIIIIIVILPPSVFLPCVPHMFLFIYTYVFICMYRCVCNVCYCKELTRFKPPVNTTM